MRIKHKKVATKPDQPDVEVNKNEWNDNHLGYFEEKEVGSSPYTVVEADDIILVRTGPAPGAAGPVTININVDTDVWPIGVAKRFTDFDLNAETYPITLDAGVDISMVPNTIRGTSDAQTYVMSYNGQSLTLWRRSETFWMVF